MMQIYTLKLQFATEFEAEVSVSGSVNLYDLAEFFIHVLGFDFDHAFAFYDNPTNHYRSKEKYTLFADMGEPEDGEPGVKGTLVQDVFKAGKKMLFYFDYGDDWRFLVTCTQVTAATNKRKIRKLLSSKGTPPEQYPDYDDEEEDEEE